MYLLNDAYIGRSLDVYGEYSEGEIDLFRQLLRPGDVAIDAGANIGALTVGMARLVAAWRRDRCVRAAARDLRHLVQ